jgi:hypothetical protein
MISRLIFLSRDIFGFVANYFLNDDEQNKIIFRFPYDWRNFMNTNKGYWAMEKRKPADCFVRFAR